MARAERRAPLPSPPLPAGEGAEAGAGMLEVRAHLQRLPTIGSSPCVQGEVGRGWPGRSAEHPSPALPCTQGREQKRVPACWRCALMCKGSPRSAPPPACRGRSGGGGPGGAQSTPPQPSPARRGGSRSGCRHVGGARSCAKAPHDRLLPLRAGGGREGVAPAERRAPLPSPPLHAGEGAHALGASRVSHAHARTRQIAYGIPCPSHTCWRPPRQVCVASCSRSSTISGASSATPQSASGRCRSAACA